MNGACCLQQRYKLYMGNSMPTDTLFADPSPILMKFGKLGGLQKKLIHTKFQHSSTIFNGVRALWRFEEFYIIIWPRGTKLVITRRLIVQISIFWYHFIENTIVFPMIYYEMNLALYLQGQGQFTWPWPLTQFFKKYLILDFHENLGRCFIMICKGSLQNFVLENELFPVENGERGCVNTGWAPDFTEIITAIGHMTQV